jgi:hypothetical protein
MRSETNPPPPKDGAIRLGELVAYARLFDEISDREQYPAVDFISWLSAEVQEGDRQRRRQSLPAGRPGLGKVISAA